MFNEWYERRLRYWQLGLIVEHPRKIIEVAIIKESQERNE